MKKSKIIGITLSVVLVSVMCLVVLPVAAPHAVKAAIPLPTVIFVPETPTNRAFDPAAGTNYQSRGYVQEEYFISGNANEYELTDPDNASSFAVQIRTPNLPYKTRILIRRPADPSLFSGNVIVEFMNPSGGYDIATAWACYWNQIMRNGDVWVGVTCKKTIVYSTCTPGVPQGLKVFNYPRYATLSFARDRAQAWDIFTQLGALLKSSDPSNPLVADGFDLSNIKLIGHGYSQTGGYLITYINFFHKDAKIGDNFIYDGYLASSAAGPIWLNDDGMNPCLPSMAFGPYSSTDPRRVIQPCGVPVIHTLTETEIALPSADLNAIVTRRADSDTYPDLFRRYEIPGACHMTAGSVGPTNEDKCKTMWYVCPWCCVGTPSDFPSYYLYNGILSNIEKWIVGGTLPPKDDRIATTAAGVVIRDAYGNAKGGVRTPYVDVPIKRYFPYSLGCTSCPNDPSLCATNPPNICASCSFWCSIMGTITPFSQATLESLYRNHGGYVSKFVKSTQQLFKSGWIVEADVDIMKSGAAESDILK